MNRPKRNRLLRRLTLLTLIAWSLALLLVLRHTTPSALVQLPTVFVLPSLTPSLTATPLTPTLTPTFTLTASPTPTPFSTATASPTLTPTLSTRVAQISAIMPGVYVAPTPSPFPFGTVLLPAPPQPIEPLPDATREFPPFMGWYSFESDYPTVRYSPPWIPRQVIEASRGQYHRTEDVNGVASIPFEGEALRVRYVAAQNMGIFDLVVDGQVIDTIDAYSPNLIFPITRIYTLERGVHLLEMRHTGSKNPASEGYVIALDAIHLFRGEANLLILPPPVETFTPSPSPQPAAGIELISAPPTIQATATAVPPRVVQVSIIIAYDENGNDEVDPAEGVNGISVRVVEVGTNRVLTQAFTDNSGYGQLQVVTSAPSRVVVPYFGQTWAVPTGRAGGEVRFTLLLTPGNQPGLIP
ncbi:MAG: hypothetical protein SF029_11180 [bacterium]|nr:hypothetical protein [bacterium]